MKHLSILAIAAVVICSCNDSNTTADNKMDSTGNLATAPVQNSNNDTIASSGQQPNTDMSPQSIDNTPLDKNSSTFAMEAASGGMMEVTMGQLAQQKGNSQRVKDYGAMLVSDHSKVNTELSNIAAAKNAQLPSALEQKQQKHIDDLSKKEGADFDRAYIKMMVNDHEKDIKAFEKAAASSSDNTLKEFATRTLPVLRAHLDSAKAIQQSLK